MKKLYIETDPDAGDYPAVKILPDTDPIPPGFVEKTDIRDWDKYGPFVLNDKGLRDIFIDQLLVDYSIAVDEDKKRFVVKWIWPDGTPEPELLNLFSEEEREEFLLIQIDKHRSVGCLIRPSTEPGSTNYLNWTADDGGTQQIDILAPHEIIV